MCKYIDYCSTAPAVVDIFIAFDECECVSDKIQLKSHNNSFSSVVRLITNGLKIEFKFIIALEYRECVPQHMRSVLAARGETLPFVIYLIGQCR